MTFDLLLLILNEVFVVNSRSQFSKRTNFIPMKSYRKSNDLSLKEALEAMIKSYRLEDKMNQVKLINAWEKVMGPAVAHRTIEIKIIDKTLFVTLSSASLRQELFMAKEKIISSLNEEVNAKVLEDVVFK